MWKITLEKCDQTTNYQSWQLSWTYQQIRYKYQIWNDDKLIHSGDAKSPKSIRSFIHHKGLAENIFVVNPETFQILSKSQKNPIKMMPNPNVRFEKTKSVSSDHFSY